MHEDLPRLLDELGANATAAPTVQLLDGWVLRAAEALPFRRSSCVLPWTGPADLTDLALDARLAVVRGFYGPRGLPARFQVGAAPRPADLDARLAERGFEVEAPVDVLAAGSGEAARRTTPGPGPPSELRAEVTHGVDAAWIERYAEAHADDEQARARVLAYGTLLSRIGPPVVTVAAYVGVEVAGVGFGVIERGWLGVFGMGTRPPWRRRGVARSVLGALARAAEATGAARVYLQVERDNHPALALYEGAGFAVVHGYHYRTETAPDASA